MRSVPAVAGRQFGVFTADQARESGWTDAAIRHAVARGTLVRLRAGVFAEPYVASGIRQLDASRRLTRAAAACGLKNPGVPISHAGAAVLMELPIIDAPKRVCVTTSRAQRGRVTDAHVHRGVVAPGMLYRANRILVTSPARTVVDVGREFGADAAITVADAALRRGLVTPTALAAAVAAACGWPGVRTAARAIPLADPRSESPLESVSRVRIHDAGLPAPELQTRLTDVTGRFVGRVDFYWDEFGVVGEADGLSKYDHPRALRAEKERQEQLERCGLIVVRWGWADLRDFAVVAHRLRAAFSRGTGPDRAARSWTAVPFAA